MAQALSPCAFVSPAFVNETIRKGWNMANGFKKGPRYGPLVIYNRRANWLERMENGYWRFNSDAEHEEAICEARRTLRVASRWFAIG